MSSQSVSVQHIRRCIHGFVHMISSLYFAHLSPAASPSATPSKATSDPTGSARNKVLARVTSLDRDGGESSGAESTDADGTPLRRKAALRKISRPTERM